MASVGSGITLPSPGPALPLRSSVTNFRCGAEGQAHGEHTAHLDLGDNGCLLPESVFEMLAAAHYLSDLSLTSLQTHHFLRSDKTL